MVTPASALRADDPAGPVLRDAVARALNDFLDRQDAALAALSPDLAPLANRARAFTEGGKRLRPAFCLWGYVACGGQDEGLDAVTRVAASLDLLHVSALVHDDVMDASDTRRGLASAHRQFEADHARAGLRGDSGAFGRAGAILLGDLLLMWSAELFDRSGLPQDALAQGRPYLEAARTEVTAGQFLDILAQAQHPLEASRTPQGHAALVDRINTVVTHKSASYTVRRPLDVGAALAGATQEQHDALAAYALPLGRAFQWRDDLLGVFGDEHLTGKESGEDLREGKLTLLVAEAFAALVESDAARLASLLGRPDLSADDVAEARALITASGAVDRVERAIDAEYERSLAALADADLTDGGRLALARLAEAATRRTF